MRARVIWIHPEWGAMQGIMRNVCRKCVVLKIEKPGNYNELAVHGSPFPTARF